MNKNSEIEDIRDIIKVYDDGDCTEAMALRDISEVLMEEKINAINRGNICVSFTAGSFKGPLPHTYSLLDYSSQTSAWYPFTTKNVVRFFWNKLVEKCNLRQYHWTW